MSYAVESDCEDQGLSLISDGCTKCQYWEFGADKPTRPQLIVVERSGKKWWTCPKCKGFYGEVR